MSKSDIAGSYSSSTFSFLMNLHTDLHSEWTSLHFPAAVYKGSSSPPYPHQLLLLIVFLMIAILTEVSWNLSVLLMCICFMTKDVNPFLVYFFSHLHFWELSVQFICPFIRLFVLLVFKFLSSLFWILIFCLMNSLQKFSPILWIVSWFW
jgi:hypothetical protein